MSSDARATAGAAGQPPARANNRLAGLLKRAQLLLIELYGPALASYGIDGRELAVLTSLADHGPVSQQEVSRQLGIDRTTMVTLVDGLEDKGLVERRPHPHDRRKNLLELTDTGRETFRHAGPAVDEVERQFLEPLTQADAHALKSALRALISAAISPR
jgi:DNA-binding MarR family transcriptional regulator